LVKITFEENPDVLRQKDRDAYWVKKNGISHFSYKNHINADKVNGLRYSHASYRSEPLTAEQKERDRIESKVRAKPSK